jgi:NitT/TauT family transport system substrate-binding protein
MKRMRLIRLGAALILFCAAMTGVRLHAKETPDRKIETAPTVHFGTLPVLQALPLFVAVEKGYFKDQGMQVNLVNFNSAMEKDVALSSGQIVGYFGDMMTPMVLTANKIPAKMVATIFNTPKNRRMFAIMASPKHTGQGLRELAQAGIAGSSNTVLDYLTSKLLKANGIDINQTHPIEIKSIPIRLQMLLTGQIPAAVLPEPLASLAEQKGARAVADDAGAGLSATVLVFTEGFIKKNPGVVRLFLKTVEQASLYINKHPDEVRAVMNRDCKVPEPLQKTFPIPEFQKLTAPASNQVMDVHAWLRTKGIIKSDMTYTQMVTDGYLP